MFWVYGYTGEIADINWKQLSYFDEAFFNRIYTNNLEEYYESFVGMYIVKNNPELEEFYSKAFYETYPKNKVRMSDGAFGVDMDSLIENKNRLFVLQSKRNYSSGEHFVELLHNVENVVTVGTNTNGCIHTGMVSRVRLPNSGLSLMFSQTINIGPDKELDIYGIEPDIYIASEDAQQAVLRCIEYYETEK